MHSTRKKNLSGSEFVPPGGRTLQILKAKVSDGGKYSCVAMNAAGEAHKHIYLTVFSESTPTLCIHRATDVPLMAKMLFPLPSSSEYQGQQRRIPRGCERPCWEIGNSGVRVQCRASADHYLVQEWQDGDRVSQSAHPGRRTDASDPKIRGERCVLFSLVFSVILISLHQHF